MIAPSKRGTITLRAHSSLAPQTQQILRALQERGSLTAKDAVEMSPPCYRLAARIEQIRSALGSESVVTQLERHNGGRHARYVWIA